MNQLMTITPGRHELLTMIDRADLQPSTKTKYKSALTAYLDAGGNLADADQLADYAAGLSSSGRAFLKAVVRLWTAHVGNRAKASADPASVAAVTATLYRLDAINEAIQAPAAKGQKAHTWLTQAEVRKLLATCDTSLIGRRDKVILSLLVGAGLRRAELAGLTFEAITWQPGKGGKLRTVLQVKGKGAKDRIIPISDGLANLLDAWHGPTGGKGKIVRSVDRAGNLGTDLSEVGIFKVVAAAGAVIGRPELAPHDLRRTYAQIGYDSGVPIVQISRLLGHSNIAVTQRYLNLDLDLETTVSDFVPVV